MKIFFLQMKLLGGMRERDQRGSLRLHLSVQRRVGGVAVRLQTLIAILRITRWIVHQIIGLAHPRVDGVHGPAFFRRRETQSIMKILGALARDGFAGGHGLFK